MKEKNITQCDRRSFLALSATSTFFLGKNGFKGNSLGGIEVAKRNPRHVRLVLSPLPYEPSALAPYISEKTLTIHYHKHHAGYLEKLNTSVKSIFSGKRSLEDIVRVTRGKPDQSSIFNSAAQVWNHNFYWHSMTPKGGNLPKGKLQQRIVSDFGTLSKLKQALAEAANTQFGSGWAWLLLENGRLMVTKTNNAELPLNPGQIPLLTIDVWEHAYYLDYQNRRSDYIRAYLDHLVNWEFAETNLDH